MRIYDLINKKKKGLTLSDEEIQFAVSGFTSGEIPDYQMSALLMSICLQGMTSQETYALTTAMASSGDISDLSSIPGIKVDKHSTGGVGDKTTLIVSPIVASLGVPIAKMSGRGLGHTGGTIDKLESIPSLRTAFSSDEFIAQVRDIGICIAGQSGNLAPADKKLYALRDVTCTVDSIPLIASSIMSKKIAAGANCILLDVKTGSGAFMKTTEEAIELAQLMVDIGESAGRKTVALVTDMDVPLGWAIGNSLEVIEACDTLRGCGPADLTTLCLELAAHMLVLAEQGTHEECRGMAEKAISSGEALKKLADMIETQGGSREYILNTGIFAEAAVIGEAKAEQSGYISHMDVAICGEASCILGAGRLVEGDSIDFSAGIILHKKTGDYVKKGDVLALLHTSSDKLLTDGRERFLSSIEISGFDKPSLTDPIVYATIGKGYVQKA